MEKKYLVLAISSGLLVCPFAQADYHFDPAFIGLGGAEQSIADLGVFEKGDSIPPGNYSVDAYVNNTSVTRLQVMFTKDISGHAKALFTRKQLESVGVKSEVLPPESPSPDIPTLSLEALFSMSSVEFDMDKLQLNLMIPQRYLRNHARGYIEPENWDEGINALMLNYRFNGNRDWGNNRSKSNFLSFQSGLNWGAWRVRDSTDFIYVQAKNVRSHIRQEHLSTYVERNIESIKSQLQMGETNSSGAIFDAVRFRGIQLASDQNMLPDSQRGFAPTVRGIAQSNAKVTIKQHGYTLYQTYVPPGAFEIDDLYPTSSSGDLDVTVDENNGSSQHFVIPYSTVPVMQRDGHIQYELNAGKYRNTGDRHSEPRFFQGNMQWGVGFGVTLYGGAQVSDNYKALALGIGNNMGLLGALSLDIIQAHSILADQSEHNGQSLRFLYAKSLNNMGTTFKLMGYRYSTEGFYTLSDTTYRMMSGYNNNDDGAHPDYHNYYNLYYTRKEKLQLNINQALWGGSVYFNASQQRYWHTGQQDKQFQAGYGGASHGVNYSLNLTYDKVPGRSQADQRAAFSVSVPFSIFSHSDTSNSYAMFNHNVGRHDSSSSSLGISGFLLEDNNLNYNMQQSYGYRGDDVSGNVSTSYSGQYNKMTLGYNYNKDSRQINYGTSGSIVLHGDGVTFGQSLGSTNILVSAPGAINTSVENNQGIKTDSRGYAIIPYANAYHENRVALNTSTLAPHIDMDENVTRVVPTEGALVRARFLPHVGGRTLMRLTRRGQPLPFGAVVTRNGGGSSIVGDDGQTYISGLTPDGILYVQWGAGNQDKCQVNYHLSEAEMAQPISETLGTCL